MLQWLFKKKPPGAPLPEKAASSKVLPSFSADQPNTLAQAIAIRPMDPTAHFDLGKNYLEMDRIDEAKVCLEKALALKPDYAEARYNLGNVFRLEGKLEEALACYKTAISLNPNDAEVHNNEGVVHETRGDRNAAIVCYRRALSINPGLADAHYNLGRLLLAEGISAEALACFEKAISIKPDFAEAHNAAGIAYNERRQWNEAIASYRRALSIDAGFFDVHYNLGLLLLAQGNSTEAFACIQNAILLNPGFARAHGTLGDLLREKGELNEAIASYQRALSLDPGFADAHNCLGVTFQRQENLSEAIASFRKAVSIKSDFAAAHSNLGMTLAQIGQHDKAVAALRQAVSISPDFAVGHSNLLFCLSHDPHATPDEVFAEHRAFGDRFEAPFRGQWTRHHNRLDPGRALRVGFVSADLRAHAVANFIQPLWAALDPKQVQIWVYFNHFLEDEITLQFKRLAHQWRKVPGMSDEELAGQIREDEIDILIDLSGHTGDNRLLTFARKPAPIQVSCWIGNPNTTGLQAMDYFLADRFSAPPGLMDALFTEKIVRLPSGALFQPVAQAPEVNDLPALQTGELTFGSFNRSDKVGQEVVALWSRVLNALPGSRMLLGGLSDAYRKANLEEQFARNGVATGRVSFRPRVGMAEYLASHHQVDLILDTFPFGGGATSCHAAWMGVPALTLAGETMSSRVGAMINSNLGLPEFITETEDMFVAHAAGWSQRLPELATLRADLRAQMLASPLCQTQAAARWLEAALRTMWQRWCEGKRPESFSVNP
jgi:protein O-GlcNAc transferase